MGHQEIFEFLKKHRGKWFVAEELSKRMNLSVASVRVSLKKLRENRNIYFRKMNNNLTSFEYLYK